MCKYCDDIDKAFINAKADPHKSFMPLYEFLLKKLEEEHLEVYAGDCKFREILKIIGEERHYTVCFYLQCIECKVFYFFGNCIRGVPIYKKMEKISEKELTNMLWGNEGTYFKNAHSE